MWCFISKAKVDVCVTVCTTRWDKWRVRDFVLIVVQSVELATTCHFDKCDFLTKKKKCRFLRIGQHLTSLCPLSNSCQLIFHFYSNCLITVDNVITSNLFHFILCCVLKLCWVEICEQSLLIKPCSLSHFCQNFGLEILCYNVIFQVMIYTVVNKRINYSNFISNWIHKQFSRNLYFSTWNVMQLNLK